MNTVWNKNEKWAPFEKEGGSGLYDDEVGSLVSYAYYWDNSRYDWREVSNSIRDTLRFDHYGKGRSSVVFTFKTPQGISYPMFLSDFVNAFTVHKLTSEAIDAEFNIVKKGANYGIKIFKIYGTI